jgi:hypothetical protein
MKAMWGIAAVLLAAGVAAAQPNPALRIVVVEGEDAVNIIQQKTAVAPVVEIRDRNNLPVPGALVTFSIEGGKAATFGGASTLTVATNAAGQAAVTGLTPSAAGAFQIQVSAAFQGQVATATIAQTNVVTAAQAAAASAATSGGGSAGSAGGGGGASSSAGGAGGAAGGGGGLSATTIAVAGAAVAGGALAATQIADKAEGDVQFTGTFTGTITGTISSVGVFNGTCTYTRSVSATARLQFKDFTDTSVNGKFDYEGTDTVVSSNCSGTAPTPPQFIGGVDLSGSKSRFSGQNRFPTPTSTGIDGGTITGEHIYTFEGSINGDTATGTFRYEQQSQSTGGGGGPVQQNAIGTFTITFTKS